VLINVFYIMEIQKNKSVLNNIWEARENIFFLFCQINAAMHKKPERLKQIMCNITYKTTENEKSSYLRLIFKLMIT